MTANDHHPALDEAPAIPSRPGLFPGYAVAGVATAAFIASAPGQTFLVSQFNTPLSTELGIAPIALNTAYTVATVAAAFPLVFIGRLTDRIGPRRAMALVATAFGLACAAMAGVVELFTVFVGFFLLRFLGQGALTLVAHHAVAMWFHRRLGTVQATMQVVLFGVWVGFPMGTVALIDTLGWRWAYVALGAGVVVTVVPLALRFLRDRPEDLGLSMDNAAPALGEAQQAEAAFSLHEARRTRAFWAVAAIYFLSPLIGTAYLFDMQPLMVSRGFEATAAAGPITAWTATMAIFAIPAGLLTDRAPPAPLLTLGSLGIAAASALLWQAESVEGAAVAMIALGLSQSIISSCGAATIARYFGRAHHGAIRASISRIAVVGTGLGPLATGLSAHVSGGYDPALLLFAIACLPVAALTATLRPPALAKG